MLISGISASVIKSAVLSVGISIGIPTPSANASESDVVEIMLCYEGEKNMEACSERFIESCLDKTVSSVEQPGIQRGCLIRLTIAWDGIQAGLLRRAQTTYSGEHKARFIRYVSDWARYDESACAFNTMEFAPRSREMEGLYCRLSRVLKRAQFLIDVYDSAQVRDPRAPLK